MIPKLLETWESHYEAGVKFRTLGFKTKSAAKRFLRAKGATADNLFSTGVYRYKDGRAVRLFLERSRREAFLDRGYPWQVHELQK